MRPRVGWPVARVLAGALDRGGADARVLALLRMGTAALVFADLCDRLRDFHAFYTAAGLTPAARWGARFSLLDLSAHPRVALAGFLLALAASALVGLGLATRAALVAMFVTLLSVQHRNPFVEDGGDAVVCALVFWLMFTDAGARWSLDARRRGPAPPGTPLLVAAAPVRVLQLQIAAIYLFAFLTKTGSTWRDGSAVERVLVASDWARGLGPWLGQHPDWCRILTAATLVIEATFAPLVLLPGRLRWPRWLGLGAGLALHLGLFCTMRLGLFSLVMPLSYLAFLACPARPSAGVPAPPPRTAAPVALGLLALLGLIMAGQLTNLTARRFPRPLAAPLEALGLRQDWRMFAPDAPKLDVRFFAPGRFADGHRTDLVTTATLGGLGQHRGFSYSRWHRLRNSLVAQPPSLLGALGRFTCRREPTLVEFELWAEVTPVAIAGAETAPEPPRRELRLRQICSAAQR